VEVQYNSEFQSLTSSPTRSLGPHRLQIDVQDAYEIGFKPPRHGRKEDKINFPMELVSSPAKIGFDHNC
jgi:hypothetical protein